jgi:exodeoxyribonuclease VII, large subunit
MQRSSDMVYSVSKVNAYIKNMFMQDFVLNKISVEGEVSNCTYAGSNHIYFTIKDEGGTLSAVMFASQRGGLSFDMKRGQRVIVTGSISCYEKEGRYQLYATKIEETGKGELYEKYLKLKEKLEDMGMFDSSYKRQIPKFVQSIGVATAQTGAVINDIRNVSYRRNPYVRIVLAPCLVQGEFAPGSIISAIKKLDKMNLDVIIVGRGGGSIEDLYCFNDEELAETIFNTKTPIISAVGHETDFTIADFVADLRAPTPSAAAEIANFVYADYMYTLDFYKNKLDECVRRKVDYTKRDLDMLLIRLNTLSPQIKLREQKQRLENFSKILQNDFKNILENNKNILINMSKRLETVSPLKRLSGGYAYISDKDNKKVLSAATLHQEDEINVFFSDGKIRAKVL